MKQLEQRVWENSKCIIRNRSASLQLLPLPLVDNTQRFQISTRHYFIYFIKQIMVDWSSQKLKVKIRLNNDISMNCFIFCFNLPFIIYLYTELAQPFVHFWYHWKYQNKKSYKYNINLSKGGYISWLLAIHSLLIFNAFL